MNKHPYEMKNASSGEAAGVGVAGGGEAKATKQKRTINCDANHINNIVQEIRAAGLQLRSSAADTQLLTLPKVLQYFGSRGANSYELIGLGYLRPSARIADIQDTWVITSTREDCYGPDGIWHKGIARYYIGGRRHPVAVSPEVAG